MYTKGLTCVKIHHNRSSERVKPHAWEFMATYARTTKLASLYSFDSFLHQQIFGVLPRKEGVMQP